MARELPPGAAKTETPSPLKNRNGSKGMLGVLLLTSQPGNQIALVIAIFGNNCFAPLQILPYDRI
ncbi:hypothetical protein [Desulfitobacterium hafniense]|uniref:hypothetical protein n=1 Tax=Desulfitobacterium hafniense TaxID=49338 RepID=UPI001AEC4F3E|nr:hypothetical protein [Desulfitobacterium hafniense]